MIIRNSSTFLIIYCRAILRAHRLKLPLDLRILGDDYVRQEFKQHKNAPVQFLPDFFRSWRDYLTMLSVQSGEGDFGMALNISEVSIMSKEQKDKLNALKSEFEMDLKREG